MSSSEDSPGVRWTPFPSRSHDLRVGSKRKEGRPISQRGSQTEKASSHGDLPHEPVREDQVYFMKVECVFLAEVLQN